MKRAAAVIVLLALMGATTRPAGVGDAIVAYARRQKGKQVGDGECTRLAEEALKQAGAHGRARREEPAKGDYVWGTPVVLAEANGVKQGTPADIRPGDILQFRGARFERTDRRGFSAFTFDHHTAVVDRVNAKTGAITVLHQNVNGKKTVTELTVDLADLKAGWVRAYRATAGPQAR